MTKNRSFFIALVIALIVVMVSAPAKAVTPERISATPLSGTKVQIDWTNSFTELANIDWYEIEISEDAGNTWETTELANTFTSHIYSGLEPGIAYQIRINAWSDGSIEKTMYYGWGVNSIGVGDSHTCISTIDGEVFCLGDNTYGQVNPATRTNYSSLTKLESLTDIVSVWAGFELSCAIDSFGYVYCWGSQYMLGDGIWSPNNTVPTLVNGVSNAVSVEIGETHACVLISDGSAKCWGGNTWSQLGSDGGTCNSNCFKKGPFAIPELQNIIDIEAGRNNTCALIQGGDVYCWGKYGNIFPQPSSCIDASSCRTKVPQLIPSLQANSITFSPRNDYMCATVEDTVECWGSNITNAVSEFNTSSFRYDARSTRNLPFIADSIESGNQHVCAKSSLGEVACWGYNNDGQTGFGVSGTSQPFPKLIKSTGAARNLYVGGWSSCIIEDSFAVYCWGAGSGNRLLTGNGSSTGTPKLSIAAYAGLILEATAPSSPVNVSAAPRDKALDVSWDAPEDNGGSLVSSYKAVASPGGRFCTSTALSCTISDLSNGTSYTVKVTATNSAGTSLQSESSTAATPAGVPSAPSNVEVAGSNGSVSISWTASIANGTPVTSYVVTSSPGGKTCTTSGTSCTITGLTNGVPYTFNVVAKSSIGDSLASESNEVTPKGPPSTPTNLLLEASSGQVTVSWTASEANGSAVTSYLVTSNPGGKTCTTSGTSCTITGLTNGTSYTFTVTATNSVGTSPTATSSSATPAGVPSAPSNVEVAGSNGSVSISWTASIANGTPVTSYVVTSSPGGKTCTTSGTSCTITGLTNGVPYTFNVVAKSSIGDSLASESNEVTPKGPPSTPTNLLLEASSGQVTVSWTASEANGSAVTSYLVTSNPGNKTCTTSGTSCTITGLTNGTSYTFTVTATNSVGTSPTATSSSATPAGVPSAPSNVEVAGSNGSVSISWTASIANGTPVTSYVVTSSPGGKTCTTSGTSCTITGLTNGVPYTFNVVAKSSIGDSLASESNEVTPKGPPSTPTNLLLEASSGQVTVSWTASEANGSAVTSYLVTSNPGNKTCTTSGTSCTITGLTNGTSYTFTVTATNSVGTSPTATSSSATPAGVPSAPSNVEVAGSNGSVSISWTASIANGTPVTSYVVTSSPGGKTCTTSGTSCTITGLTNGVPYTFNVVAKSSIGDSLASESNEVTPKGPPSTPTNLLLEASSGQVTVSWTASEANGSAVTSYLVTSNPGNKTCTTSGTSCTITGLTNGTSYTFTVTATNSVGTSPTATSSSAIPAGVPSAPFALKVEQIPGGMTISWTPGNANGSEIIDYFVTSNPGGLICRTTTSSCTYSDLPLGTKFKFTVNVNSSSGIASSAESNEVEVANTPTQPFVKSIVSSKKTALVTWGVNDLRGSKLLKYGIRWKLKTSKKWSNWISTNKATSYKIKGLKTGVQYEVQVSISTSMGSIVSKVKSFTGK